MIGPGRALKSFLREDGFPTAGAGALPDRYWPHERKANKQSNILLSIVSVNRISGKSAVNTENQTGLATGTEIVFLGNKIQRGEIMFMIRMFLVLWLLAPLLLQAAPDLLSIRLGKNIGTDGELVGAGLCE